MFPLIQSLMGTDIGGTAIPTKNCYGGTSQVESSEFRAKFFLTKLQLRGSGSAFELRGLRCCLGFREMLLCWGM